MEISLENFYVDIGVERWDNQLFYEYGALSHARKARAWDPR